MTANDRHADVLIVGAGASGGVMARRLAEAGLDVVCLEQGDWPDRERFPGARPEWELVAARQWSGRPHLRDLPGDYPLDLADSDVGVLNFNGVGGGTVLYGAQWPRMLPQDFWVRTLDGVADDWPLTYEELAPFSDRVDRQFGVSGLGGNPALPPGPDPPLPPLPIGAAGLEVARAHARLGWHWWPEPNAILSAPYDGRHPCVQRGTCLSGCNEGAKASTDLTHFPHLVAGGGRLLTGARVSRLLTDRRGLVAGAEWVDRSGRGHRQTAEVTVLAANGIGTPRLLLASAGAGHPDGLANSSGLVGRRLMVHPLVVVDGLFERDLQTWRGHTGGLIQCLEFATTDGDRGFLRGAKWALSSAGGPMLAAFAPPETAGVWGPDHHRHVGQRLGRSARWGIVVEDLPEETNRVELSPTLTDADGVPAPKVTYRLSENSAANMAWQADRATESLEAAGAWQTHVTLRPANGHFMGTARMGRDPSDSVVDPYGVAHDVPNLVIADGSTFVTAGSANPTATICALALRSAEHLLANRGPGRRPERSRVFGFDPPSSPTTAPEAPGARAAPATPTRHPVTIAPPTSLGAGERTRLAALAEALIPASATMPGGGPVVGRQVDALLAVRPDLGDGLRRALRRPGAPADALEGLLTEEPGVLRTLRYAVAGAYYLDPGVRSALGYPAPAPHPVRADTFPEYVAEGLLDAVTGPVVRATPR